MFLFLFVAKCIREKKLERKKEEEEEEVEEEVEEEDGKTVVRLETYKLRCYVWFAPMPNFLTPVLIF